MGENIQKLKKLWDNYSSSWGGNNEYEAFLRKYPKDSLDGLKLEDYTNIKETNDIEYFTNWLERKTENCGKFRTASSYAYGIYKVNQNNIKNEAVKAKDIYKAHDDNNKISKDYLDSEVAKKYFEKSIRPLLIKLAKFDDLETVRPLDINYARKIAYMYNIDKLIPIYKKEVLEEIASFFKLEEVDFSSYKATEPILEKIKEVLEINEDITIEISQKLASFLWNSFGKSVSFDSKNIIYYGAPGTGKTYTVQNAVKQKVLLSNDDINDVALFTQFHPSFGYEDFIEGLKPHINKGATELKLRSGIFKKFCKKAMDNLKESRENNNVPKSYYFVADEINRAELSTVFGELLLCLEESKRVDFEKKNSQLVLTENSMLIDTQYSYLIDNKEDAVIVEGGKYKFGVPSNLYFIGTMNDIDRSIDSFDLALRRRFIWERMDCDYSVIVNHKIFKDIQNLKKYIDVCKNLNNYIANDLGLGKSYEIGHSYFMDVKTSTKNITKKSMQDLFDKKLKPLIEEYLRGEYGQVEIEEKIKKADKVFSIS